MTGINVPFPSNSNRNEFEGLQRKKMSSSYLSKDDFKELFNFEENDRDKKQLKSEFKEIVKSLGTDRKTPNDSNLSKNSLSD